MGNVLLGAVKAARMTMVVDENNDDDRYEADDPRMTEEYWLKHIAHLEGSVWLFSHDGKSEREAYVCDAFLKNLNVKFAPRELLPESKQDEPSRRRRRRRLWRPR